MEKSFDTADKNSFFVFSTNIILIMKLLSLLE